MTELQIHSAAIWTVIALAIVTFVYLWRVTAPYGRHYAGAGWGPHIDNRLGWVIMELPTTVVFALIYFAGEAAWNLVPLVFLAMWQGHYLHRTFVYPFRTRTAGRKIPLTIVGSGVVFNSLNVYVNARFISSIGEYGVDWLADPRFLIGAAIFLFGMALNIRSDNILLRLRKPNGRRVLDPPRWRVPLRILPELPRRNHRMGRLGGSNVVAQPDSPSFIYTAANLDAQSAQQPCVVPGALLRTTPFRPQGAHSRCVLNRA